MTVLALCPVPVDHPDALRLISESEAELASLYAPEARHAFSPDQLIAADVHFLVARRDGAAVGCGGFATLSDDGRYGELKRVFTTCAARGLGVGRAVVTALEAAAARRGLPVMRLETGEASPDALALYAACGYARRGPFGAYRENGSSVFMEKALTG